ncbi:MAG: acyl carrier protein [Bacteroidales bacterium]|nr:acyl carrier protein [Bacteroidales bacterium]
MERHEIFAKLKSIFERIISDKTELTPETSSRDVRNWDSLNHVLFIAEIEKEFGISFDLTEMLEMRSIEDICKAIEKSINKK